MLRLTDQWAVWANKTEGFTLKPHGMTGQNIGIPKRIYIRTETGKLLETFYFSEMIPYENMV